MVDVFKALADPTRRHLLDRLNARNGQSLRQLSEGLDMARQSVSKHLAILEAANLVTTIREGREKLHYLNTCLLYTSQMDNETVVLFSHADWREASEFMAHCSARWAYFLLSMKSLVETGKGTPFPEDLKF